MNSPALTTILLTLVEERAGLHYRESDRRGFLDRVSMRAGEAGYDSLLDYYYFLRYDEGGKSELDRLVEALVIGETYFFREQEQLDLIVRDFVLPRDEVRIWSAACATGEEPLGLAMLLAERGLLPRAEIVATDLSQKNLEQARRGVFGRRSLRERNDAVLRRWSRVLGPQQVAVDPAIVSAIRWRQLNLTDARAVAQLGAFDVILCRNVLIYFSDATIAAVVETLSRALKPGGVLFVGVSESLFRVASQLGCEERGGVFFYRKAA